MMKLYRRIIRILVSVVLFSVLLTNFPLSVAKVNSMSPAQQPVNDLDWGIEYVDGRNFYRGFGTSTSTRSMVVEGYDRIHLVYGLDRLYYGVIDDTSWTVETVETVDADLGGVRSASLYLDSGNNPHVSYCRTNSYSLMYAHKVGSVWIIESIASPWSCEETALALDSANNPHIAYTTVSGAELRVASKHGASAWGITTVFSDMDYGTGKVSMVMDSSNKAQISFYGDNGVSTDLIYVRETTLSWIYEVVTTEISGDCYNALALDPSGVAHITYTAPGGLYYASRTGGVWASTLIINPAGYVKESSLAFDSTGQPHVAYRYDDHFIGLVTYNNDTGTWTDLFIRDNFPGLAIFPLYLTIDLNDANLVRIVYAVSAGLEVAQETGRGGPWLKEVKDFKKFFAEDTSIALNSSEQVFISYYDAYNGDLRMASHTGSGWNYSLLDSNGNVGIYNSIGLDSVGWPIVAYYDATAGDLMLTYYDGYSWPTITIDSAGDVGQYVDMKVDGSDVIHLCYYDATNSRLKYASYHYSSPSIVTADATVGTGKYCSLALNSTGKPYIAYYSENDGKLKLAAKPAAIWLLSDIDTTVGANADIAIALARTQYGFAVAYTGDSGFNTNVYLRTCTQNPGGCSWSSTTFVTNDVYESEGISLAVNSEGVAYVALREVYNEERLNVITCDSGVCSAPDEVDLHTVTNGSSSSMVLDSTGFPHISYLDPTYYGVRYTSVMHEKIYLPFIKR